MNKIIPEEIFRQHGGQLRMSEAIRCGISRYSLYKMRDEGVIEMVTRGIYRLVDMPPISSPDLVTVGLRFPKAVVCLISALSFHGLTTQIPHRVTIAVARTDRIPVLDYPPIQAYKFSKDAFNAGIETHQVDGVPIRVYCPEKTLADCFKFRNKIGMDVALEALKYYRKSKGFNVSKVMQYAKICRVENVMKSYLEASL
ncbi:MAG: transcriptional regulator [Gammaproteobacteria bacterium]|nr:transcriptional regulator [Gammaproteobacteria bacterium]